MAGAITRGVLFVHSAPRALCPHIEWAAGNVLGGRASFDWTAQPAGPDFYRSEHSWQGPQGTGARLASALRGWAHLRYEITEEASHGVDGSIDECGHVRAPGPWVRVVNSVRIAICN